MRNKTMTLLAGAGALAVFNLLFFIWTDSPRSAVCWISYAFMTLSFVILTLTYIYPRKGQGETYSLVVPEVALKYLAASALAGALLMFFTESVAIALTVELLMLLYFMTHIVIHVQANRRTALNVEARQHKVADLKKVAAQVKAIIDMNDVSDRQARKALVSLYDDISCMPFSASQPGMTDSLQSMLPQLGNAVYSRNWIETEAMARKMQSIIRQYSLS